MTRLRKTKISCPCCERKFSTDVIFSTIWSRKVTTDLLRFAMGSKVPVNFFVHTCPECGWSGQEENPEPVPQEIRRFIRENITPNQGKDELPPWRKWENHALINQASGCSELEVGSTLLLAAQCARLDEQYEQEKQYRLRSIDHYLKAIETGDVPEDSLYQTTYLIGELFRRTGDKWKSQEWFQKVLDMDLEHERREFFVNLARQQMTQPRSFIEEKDEREAAKGEKPGLRRKVRKLLGIREVKY